MHKHGQYNTASNYEMVNFHPKQRHQERDEPDEKLAQETRKDDASEGNEACFHVR